MSHSVERSLLIRVSMAWLFVSIVVTAIGYWSELQKFESELLQVLSQEIHSITSGQAMETGQGQALPREYPANFVTRNYVVIRFYDDKKRLVRTWHNPLHDNFSGRLDARDEQKSPDGRRHLEQLDIQDERLLHLSLPVQAGHVEGYFLLDPETIEEQRSKTQRALALILISCLATTLAIYPAVLLLYRSLLKASNKILLGNIETVTVLGTAIAKRDAETGEHNFRVTIYAIALAEATGIQASAMRHLILGAFLHDVGKIGIPDAILLKPGRLDQKEMAIMRRHVPFGLEIIEGSQWLKEARDVIACHHERFDGQGYPLGLKAENIPLIARLFAIVDVFDALSSPRPYKSPLPVYTARKMIIEGSGSQFDPQLVDRFAKISDDLYHKLSGKSEAELRELLSALLPRYFLTRTEDEQ